MEMETNKVENPHISFPSNTAAAHLLQMSRFRNFHTPRADIFPAHDFEVVITGLNEDVYADSLA